MTTTQLYGKINDLTNKNARLKTLLYNAIVWIEEENDYFVSEVDNEAKWFENTLGITKRELKSIGIDWLDKEDLEMNKIYLVTACWAYGGEYGCSTLAYKTEANAQKVFNKMVDGLKKRINFSQEIFDNVIDTEKCFSYSYDGDNELIKIEECEVNE